MAKKRTSKFDIGHRVEVEQYLNRGFRRATQIAKETGYDLDEVRHHLQAINSGRNQKKQKRLEVRKTELLEKIESIQREASNMIYGTGVEDRVKLAAMRVVIASHELEGKVTGAIQETLNINPDKKASSLLAEIARLEKKSKGEDKDEGNGHHEKDKEELPVFLRKNTDAE